MDVLACYCGSFQALVATCGVRTFYRDKSFLIPTTLCFRRCCAGCEPAHAFLDRRSIKRVSRDLYPHADHSIITIWQDACSLNSSVQLP